MKNIRKYMMAAACMTAAAALVACTEAVKRDTEEEIQEMTVPKKPGPITKVPATLTCNGGEEFTFSVSKVQWAETYEWTIAEQEKSKISIIDGQGTNVITVRVVNDDVVIPAQSVSVVAKNELGASKVREYFAAITVSVPIELPGYTIKKYGKRWWMTENCHEAGEDGNLGVAPDLTAFSVAGLEASHLQRLNDAKGRYYTWYEAMTGISGCTAEQCPYVQNYEGVDDVGNAFKLDGTEEGEFGVQIRGCCPEGWHVANANEVGHADGYQKRVCHSRRFRAGRIHLLRRPRRETRECHYEGRILQVGLHGQEYGQRRRMAARRQRPYR